MRLTACAVLALALAGCSGDAREPEPALRLWHAFNRHETEALNEALAESGRHVETALLSFARGQTILGDVLRAGVDCPDLARVDASWLPGLVEANLVAEVPPAVWEEREWLDEAAELATHRGVRHALPQAIDGLALVHRRAVPGELGVAWPPRTLDDLEVAARRLTSGGRFGLGVRVDGYWYVAFLRASGGDLPDPATGTLGIDQPVARTALERFAGLMRAGGVTPPPAAPGDETSAEIRRFRAGEVAILVQGPWSVVDLTDGEIDKVSVTAFPRDAGGRAAAPRGGQLYVVPRCARDPAGGWQLALELTDPAFQADWGRRFGVVPTTEAALAASGRVAQEFREALRAARPLPRTPVTAYLFDDLNPAIEAVVVGDASAEEALAGVERGWRRILEQAAGNRQ